MTDLVDVTVEVLRSNNTWLDINDRVSYFTGPEISTGGLVWDRDQVASRYVDGSVTVSRRKQTPEYTLVVDVAGPSMLMLQLNLDALRQAFTQDEFQLRLTMDNIVTVWDCEAADISTQWVNTGIHNKRVQVTLGFPRRPKSTSSIVE